MFSEKLRKAKIELFSNHIFWSLIFFFFHDLQRCKIILNNAIFYYRVYIKPQFMKKKYSKINSILVKKLSKKQN